MIIKDNVLVKVFPEDVTKGIVKVPNGVTTIGESAFQDCFGLKSVELPDSVTTIEKKAFFECKTLTSINFPKDLSEIKESAFQDCEELSSVVFSDNITSIGKNAFIRCKKLDFPYFPKNLTDIGENAFQICESLSHINLQDQVKNIGKSAFVGCHSVKNITIPKSLEKISQNAFSSCSGLTSIVIPENIKVIEANAFNNCTSLNSINIKEGTTEIGDTAFAHCCALTEAILPLSLTKIGKNSFTNCFKLEKIELGKNIEEIGSGAFEDCYALKSITIPSKVTDINAKTFCNCSSLKSIVLPTNLSSINELAFGNCTSLNSVSIPESVISIGDNSFANCSELESIILPKELEYLGDGAFKYCKKIENITISEKITTIRQYTFSNCSSLKSVSLPKNLEILGFYAFNNCESLEEIDIPHKVNQIRANCFSNCKNLKYFIVPNSVVVLEPNVFASCKNLESVVLSKNLQIIGSEAFKNSGIKSIQIPNSVKTIETGAFEDCENLETAKLSKNLETLMPKAFKSCTSLISIDIPNSVREISSHLFTGCSNLKEVNLSPNTESIKIYAFALCPNLNSIELPNGLINIDEGAFMQCPAFLNSEIPQTVVSIGASNIDAKYGSIIKLPGSLRHLGYVPWEYKYFKKDENGFTLSVDELEGSMPKELLNLDYPFISAFWNYRNMLFREQNNSKIVNFYNSFLSQLPDEQIEYFLNNHNFTFYKQLPIPESPDYKFDFFKALYNLGVFMTPIEVNGKKVDYAQKVVGLLLEELKKGTISTYVLNKSLVAMNNTGFKQGFTDFYIENFRFLYDLQDLKSQEGFIARCYNDFERVQKTNTNNHGEQRQLKPTVLKFMDYFNENKFTGITDENKPIARVISPYFSKQESFTRAIEILEEKKRKNIPDNILKTSLKETDIFTSIDDYATKIKELNISVLSNLTKIANNEFTFEWLSKNDPQNFILGKLCSCCSHLEGAGYGIMHASMVHPNVQTLVIKNGEGEIIAKSTLYINPQERYGVFNNVEVNTSITQAEKNKIYRKLILGINAFASEYNKQNPDIPLKQINMGMSNNDLEPQLKKHHEEGKVLQALDYEQYGISDLIYSGDSAISQLVVWKATDANKKEIDPELEL